MKRALALLAAAAVLVLSVGCSSDGDTTSGSTTSATSADAATGTTESGARPLRILVTNDDGVDAPGIDALVEALTDLPDTEVVVVAPLENQSGTAGSTTDGPLTVTEATTASGRPVKAVTGFPADSIVWAIDQGGVEGPIDLVISGINAGQNLGPATDLSGTVGAARAAAARGIPALAASQGLADTPDFPTGVRYVLDWLDEHREEILSGEAGGDDPLLEGLNIPTCTVGEVRGQVEVTIAESGDILGASDCTSSEPAPSEDIPAFTVGFVTLADVPLEPATAAG
jgi:5'-nucleotidase